MATPKILFNQAITKLAKINGLYDIKDLVGQLALQQTTNSSTSNNVRTLTETELETRIIDLFLNTYEGAITTSTLIQELSDIVRGDTNNLNVIEQIYRSFQIFYTGDNYRSLIPSNLQQDFANISINGILGYAEGQNANNNRINGAPNNPTKQQPGLSLILSNNYMIGLTRRDVNPITVFLNNVPTIEMNRCVPFVNLEVIQGRPIVHSPSNKLQSISLGKFLLGAEQIQDGTPRSAILKAQPSSVEGTANNSLENKSLVGMEIFTSPQTLINANTSYNRELRSNPVIDKFQPLLSLNDITLTVIPSTGMMSYKSGQISLTLHDRSRLSEIADFIRVDLYGTTELLLEYGWIHPDGERLTTTSTRNPYGDLINGMRLKELYHIINSSFTLDESGQIRITLQIAMRGATDFALALIGSDSENSNQIIQDIERLQRNIAELRSRVFGSRDQNVVSEIRGIQILDAAQDAMNFLSLPPEVMRNLGDFERALRNTSIPDSNQLLTSLKQLFGEVNARNNSRRNGNQTSNGGTLNQLRRSVQESISIKMNKLASTPDPMLIDDAGHRIQNNLPGRVVGQPRSQQQRRELENFRNRYNIEGVQNISVSLGKLLLMFIGEPLSNTSRYDDVQLIFYPFNSYAGKASGKNIGNFAVDLEYFAENFFRWRLGRLGQNANVNLTEFISFVQDIIIDDPSARSYGLFDGNQPLFREILSEEGQAISVESVDSPEVHIDRVNRILANVTPDGTFRMPQVECFIETLPERIENSQTNNSSSGSDKTILRLHFFDRQTTPYDSLGALLQANRNNEIRAVGNIANNPNASSNEGVNQSRARVWSDVIAAAEQMNILERVPNTGDGSQVVNNQTLPSPPVRYQIKGGPQQIKDFLYNTMPYIRYGNIGSNVQSANLSSINDPQLSTVNLLRSFRRSDLEPNGENPGGLPMRIIPTEVTINTIGCPLINFAQQFFVDFQTGTTADNIYGVVGVTHKLGPGIFDTDIKLCPLDAYGQYFNLVGQVQTAITELENLQNNNNNPQGS
jgi:hypothetical protein